MLLCPGSRRCQQLGTRSSCPRSSVSPRAAPVSGLTSSPPDVHVPQYWGQERTGDAPGGVENVTPLGVKNVFHPPYMEVTSGGENPYLWLCRSGHTHRSVRKGTRDP